VPPELIGHRGARARYPENTLEGFRAARAAGCHHFEIDVAMTRDDVLVLSHDSRLHPDITRGPGGAWLRTRPVIRSLDFAALQEYDVGRIRPGTKTASLFPDQQPIDGARIPTLDEVLRLDDSARWTIEIKTSPREPDLTAAPEAIAEQVAAVADRAGAAPRIVVQSFDWRGPRHLRRQRPDLAYAWLTCRGTGAWRGGQARLPGAVAEEGGGTWTPQHNELTPRLLAAAHRMGLRVTPWTVNAPEDIRRFAAWGVDGIITDDPALARFSLQDPASPP
jgi:glycerophosphoryl diester phosphodiesterase